MHCRVDHVVADWIKYDWAVFVNPVRQVLGADELLRYLGTFEVGFKLREQVILSLHVKKHQLAVQEHTEVVSFLGLIDVQFKFAHFVDLNNLLIKTYEVIEGFGAVRVSLLDYVRGQPQLSLLGC